MKKNYLQHTRVVIIFFCNIFSSNLSAQTNPAAQSLPYSQNFAGLAHASVTYPAGWQSWNLGNGSASSFVLTPGLSDFPLQASSTAATATGGAHNYSGTMGFLAVGLSPSGTANPAMVLAINTSGRFNVAVSYSIMTIRNPYNLSTNNRINQCDLQYRVGTSGNFIGIGGLALYQNNTINQTTAITTPQNSVSKNITLPAACNNQPVVQLRWVQRNASGTVGTNWPSFAVDNIGICATTLNPSISISGPEEVCSGGPSVYTASVTNGGSIPFYQWKKNGINTGTNNAMLTISGLNAGDQISCVLTSNAPCLSSLTATSNTITISNTNNSPEIFLESITDESCTGSADGAIDISVSGGAEPYTICWDTVNASNIFIVTVGGETPANPNPPSNVGLSFYVDGVETKELFLTRGFEYFFNVSGGHPFHISTDLVGASSIGLVSNGQTGAPTGFGTVTFKPNNLHPSLLYYPCASHTYMGYRVNIDDGYCIEDPTGLKAGNYSVTVTDANGCTSSASFTVNSQPSSIVLDATVTDASCDKSNGSINLDISGGTGPYTACWDTVNKTTGPVFGITVGSKTPGHPYFNQGSALSYFIDGVEAPEINLVRGTEYSFNIFGPGHPWFISTDIAGGNGTFGIVDGLNGAPSDNGTVTFIPDNSHSSLLYYVCANHQYMGYNVNISDAYCVEDPADLSPGIYTVNVTDANGCTATSQFVINEIPGLSLAADITDATCNNNGAIDLIVNGGVPPYTVCWDTTNIDNGGQFGVSFATKTAAHPMLGQGSAIGYVIDGIEGLEVNLTRGIPYTFNVLAPNHPFRITTDLAGGTTNNVVTNGQSGAPTQNGTVSFQPDSTHPSQLYYSCEFHQFMGYNINMMSGYCTEDLTEIGGGIYSVVVTDANGCSVTSQFTVNEVTPLSVNSFVTDATCNTINDGSIDITVDGGTGPYSICWDTVNTANGNQFAVTSAAKTSAHPMFGQGSAIGYIVDGIEGKEVVLTRGIPYEFFVFATNHPFRITTDLAGGTTNNVVVNGQTGAPTQNGLVTFQPDNTHASLLYYSCEFHQFMGYNVQITDGYCIEDLSNVYPGEYTATITDAFGCSLTETITVGQSPQSNDICGNGLDDDCDGIVDNGQCGTELNLRVLIEGYYIGSGQMVAAIDPLLYPAVSDTITVELASDISPYTKLYTQSSLVDTGGHATLLFPQNVTGGNYYIVVRHRNALETWSGQPVIFTSATDYDFTTGQSKAFGNNMIQSFDLQGWCIYSGDISNSSTGILGSQDGVIESQDYLEMENAVSSITIGYTPGDVTGDGVVESSDYTIMENNVSSIIFTIQP